MIETQVLMKVSDFYGFSRNCFLEGGLTIQGGQCLSAGSITLRWEWVSHLFLKSKFLVNFPSIFLDRIELP